MSPPSQQSEKRKERSPGHERQLQADEVDVNRDRRLAVVAQPHTANTQKTRPPRGPDPDILQTRLLTENQALRAEMQTLKQSNEAVLQTLTNLQSQFADFLRQQSTATPATAATAMLSPLIQIFAEVLAQTIQSRQPAEGPQRVHTSPSPSEACTAPVPVAHATAAAPMRASYAAAAKAGVSAETPGAAPQRPASQHTPNSGSAKTRRVVNMLESQRFCKSFILVTPADNGFAAYSDDAQSAVRGILYCMESLDKPVEPVFAARLNTRPNPDAADNEPGHVTSDKSIRILFSVETQEEADALVRARREFKGRPGFGIFDVLSPEEEKAHAALWPQFLAARARGQKAQFNRARLKIDGKVIHAPSA